MDIFTWDTYAENDKIYIAFAGKLSGTRLPYIGYVESDDSGFNWLKPVEIKPIKMELEAKAGNDIQLVVTGDRMTLMLQVTGDIPGMGPINVWVSNDHGNTWQMGNSPTQKSDDQSHYDLMVGKDNFIHAVWLDDADENGYQGLRYARSEDGGLNWHLQQTLDDSTCSCCWNKILISQFNVVHVVYRDMEPRDMALTQSFDNGKTWQRVSTVGDFKWKFSGCPHNGGSISEDEVGHLHSLVWTGLPGKTGLYYLKSTDNGRSWLLPVPIENDKAPFHSDMVHLFDNHIVVIWDEKTKYNSAVFVTESNDNGKTWSHSAQMSKNEVSASFPKMIKIGKNLVATWLEEGNDKIKHLKIAVGY